MITRLNLKNLTTFSDLTIDLSPKINVIIGENGTGKTHLLKAAYGLCAGAPLFRNKPDTTNEELGTALTTTFQRLFMPLDGKIGKMHHQGAPEKAHLSALFHAGQEIAATFNNNSQALSIQKHIDYESYQAEAVFFPAKEVLSFMKGFASLYERYELSFDKTYQDICLFLDLPPIRKENLQDKAKWAMDEIETLCGGRFVFYGGGNVTFKTKTAEFSANAMAEGFRKMGMLARLLETGAIQPGVSGPLFWDEPEANLNPKLLQLLVKILLQFSRMGQQIILTTHDYVLLKWFDIEATQEDHIVYHSLYREKNGDVCLERSEDYRLISSNPIAQAFNDLTKEQVNKILGGLGQ